MAGESDPKQLRFQVIVDNASAENAKRVIREITTEVTRLVTELNRASQAGLGGLFGGASNRVATGPGGSLPAAAPVPGGMSAAAKAGGAANTLVSALLDNKNALKGVAYESRDAMRAMSDAVRSGIYHQRNEVERLRGEVARLSAEYKQLGVVSENAMKVGRVSDSITAAQERSKVGEEIIRARGRAHAAQSGLDELESMQDGRFRGAARQLGQGNFRGAAGAVLGSGVVQGVGAALFAAKVVADSSMAANREALQNDYYARGARAGGSVGGLGMQIRGGGLAQQLALEKLFETGEAQQILGRGRPNLPGEERGIGGFFGYSLNKVTDWLSPADQTAARRRLAAYNTVGGGGGLGALNPFTAVQRGLDYQRSLGNINAEEMERLVEVANQRAQMDARATAYTNAYAGQYGTRMGLMRALGVGETTRQREPYTGRVLTVVNGQTGKIVPGKPVDAAMQAGFGSTFTSPEIAGMADQLKGMAGYGNRFAAGGILPLVAGGLYNAPQLFGAGAQYGGRGLLNAAQGGIGSGGLDITAGGNVADLVTQSLLQGGVGGMSSAQAGTALRSFMAAARGATGSGTPGADMLGARMLGNGMGAYNQQILGAGLDPLQKGINVLASVRAMPGGSIYQRHKLEQLDATQIQAVLSGKSMPGFLSDRGITKSDVQRYVEEQEKLQFSRYVTGTGASSDVEKAVLAYRGSGQSLHEYFRGMKPGQRRKQLRLLGEALSDADVFRGPGGDQTGQGILMAQLADVFPKLRGRGAHDPAAGTLAAEEKRRADVQQSDMETFLRDNRDTIKKLTESNKDWADAADRFSKAIGQESAAFVRAAEKMTEAMNAFVSSPGMRPFARAAGIH